MSYILDALKRAEAERERGSVPGLHARPVVSYNEVDDPVPRYWIWLISAALVLTVGGAGFWWWRAPAPLAPTKEPATLTKTPSPAPELELTVLPPTQSLSRTVPTVVVSNLAPAAPTLTGPATAAMAPHAPQAARVPVAVSVGSPSPAPVPIPTPKLAPTTQALPPALTNPLPVTPSSNGSSIPMLNELPDALRRQIPALTIAGAVYSDDPSQRMLLINNLAVGPGNTVAPGVQLEEIQTTSSVFNFQGTRFQVNH